MTEKSKRQIETVYGSLEAETIICDSCGVEVLKDTAARFAMDTEAPDPYFNEAERTGYACKYCYEEGPTSFPEKAKEYVFYDDDKRENDPVLAFLIYTICSALFPMTLIISLKERKTGKVQTGVLMGTLGTLTWIGIIYALYLLTML